MCRPEKVDFAKVQSSPPMLVRCLLASVLVGTAAGLQLAAPVATQLRGARTALLALEPTPVAAQRAHAPRMQALEEEEAPLVRKGLWGPDREPPACC